MHCSVCDWYHIELLADRVGMCTCTCVHDNDSCMRLHNYTRVYMNMPAGLNLVLKVKKRLKQSTEERGIFCDLVRN